MPGKFHYTEKTDDKKKTSDTFAVKSHTNPAVFIQHACHHSVIQKDKLNAQILSYHIHILYTKHPAYFIAINVSVIFRSITLNVYQYY